jgi:arylsulfatase A-like enzyme
MGAAGNREIRTPNLDRLCTTGMRFDHFFCASPVCSPARATLMTGRIPSQHGVHDWLSAGNTVAKYEPHRQGELIAYLKGQTGYTDVLAAAGYVCGISGKWHLGDSHHAQKSFSFWKVHSKGGGPYYNAPMVRNGEVYEESRYVTDVITDNALQFLERQVEGDKPFYLSVHYTAPHSPWQREHHPPDLYDAYHEHCAFRSVPDGLQPPAWVRHIGIPVRNAQERRSCLSGYYAAVTAMDGNIGRLIDWLEAHELRDNTLIVFTSDNGMNMGHHGVFGKGNATFPLNMLEESVKVPFVVSQPGAVPEGATCSALLSQYDFMPTLLDVLGVARSNSASLPGRSFAQVLGGGTGAGREFVVVYDEYGPVRMVRTTEWKYVHRYPYGPHELYCLTGDPGEESNLAGKPEHRRTENDMRARLTEWCCRYVDPARDGTHEAVTGSGQWGRCGVEGKGADGFSQARVEALLRAQPFREKGSAGR